MDAAELGRLLRARRTAGGLTIAQVAAEAGLSVPYIANLENGRGNPTLAALDRLAAALGMRLDVDLAPADRPATGPADPGGPAAPVARLARDTRLRAEVASVAARTGVAESVARQRVLAALAAVGAATGREPTARDLHRLLDVLALATLEPAPNSPET